MQNNPKYITIPKSYFEVDYTLSQGDFDKIGTKCVQNTSMFSLDDDGILKGFDDIERSAEKSLEQALSKVEDSLNEEPKSTEGVTKAAETSPEVTDDDPYRRFGENMYEAHVDQVGEKEIRQWQRAFPYYRLKGSCILPQMSNNEKEYGEGVVMVSQPELYDEISAASPSPPHEIPRSNSRQFSRPSTILGNHKKADQIENNLAIVGMKCEIRKIAGRGSGRGRSVRAGGSFRGGSSD